MTQLIGGESNNNCFVSYFITKIPISDTYLQCEREVGSPVANGTLVDIRVQVGPPQPKALVSHVPKTFRACAWKVVPEHGGAWRCVEGDAPGKKLLVTGSSLHGLSELVSLDGSSEIGQTCVGLHYSNGNVYLGGGIVGMFSRGGEDNVL